jgi:hypothetical protein
VWELRLPRIVVAGGLIYLQVVVPNFDFHASQLAIRRTLGMVGDVVTRSQVPLDLIVQWQKIFDLLREGGRST